MQNDEYGLLLARSATYCSLSEHCVLEVVRKLNAWGADSEQIEKIIEHLIGEKYIDEQRFANAYARDKLRFNHWGKIKIGMLLGQKGIDNETINNALEDIDATEYETVLSDLLKSKQKTVKSTSDYEKRAKLMRVACGKGFEFGDIERALKEIV
ncbi:MAG: RecX family transcriptional regulator [Prevotellaceae bacterium]|jgi:regulatory protein|nr:RecX family transcriptional regulator [Prevotellaceae bacterium]